MELGNTKNIYFIGIGGIGMSAIARYFNLRGVKVSGYDKTETPLTLALKQEGIEIHFEENVAMIPKDVDVVVYTPAVPKEHLELVYYQQNNFTVVKRSDILQLITDQSKVIAVAGTHGKTTTSSMIAHLLKHSGFDCTAFLGGITANYNSNFLVGKNEWVVVEADEYDRSFLKLFPQIAVITAVDPDHLDIYKGGLEDFENTFLEFASQVKEEGTLFYKMNIPIQSKIKNLKSKTKISYSLDLNESEIKTENIVYKNGTYHFDISHKGTLPPRFVSPRTSNNVVSEDTNHGILLNGFELNVHGLYNIENAVAAIAVGLQLNIELEKIKAAMAAFKGVKRRFEYIVKNDKTIYIDDYAHHPNELAPFLKSVRSIYPDKKITVIFQPHLFSRTRDFAQGFSESLSLCDELILLPIYPARELPMEGVNSEMLLKDITIPNKKIVEKKDLMNELKSREIEVLCTVGAGDIDQFIEPIKEYLLNK